MKPKTLPTSKQVELAKERMSIENEFAKDPMFRKYILDFTGTV
jgi:hypothetical protein